MDYIQEIAGSKRRDIDTISNILDKSLTDKDPMCRESQDQLRRLGLDNDTILMLLACQKSQGKYGYNISPSTLSHIFDLARQKEKEAPLLRLFRTPFLLVKTCWLYEHAPAFLYFDRKSKELDNYIIKFSQKYESHFLRNRNPISNYRRIKEPSFLKSVFFWENKTFDPVSMVKRVMKENLIGFELSIDFHPFNYTKLLPEELSLEKRAEIKEACERTGITIDIHSPIVGPYSPYPHPEKGRQLFYNPTKCFELQCEVIELAKDINAGAVVVHIINSEDLGKIADLIMLASGSKVRVTIENYCHTGKEQGTDFFISVIDEISRLIPEDVKKKNFGMTFDVGHFNIEGQDPLIASEIIGRYCLMNDIYLRVHATDNYGELLFNPPAYSADVHGNVAGRGINNAAVIKLLRSMGHELDVVAEQILPLSKEDIKIIHEAQTFPLKESYENYLELGKKRLNSLGSEELINSDIIQEKAYQFLAGMEDVYSLREHLIFRKIQDKKYLSVEHAKKVSQDFMKMPQKLKKDMVGYIDNLLLPIQSETGSIQKNELDMICQNISGALFGSINNEHLIKIFSNTSVHNKGDIICMQNTPGQEMYLIREGKVDVLINDSHITELGTGEIFGEISLFYNVKRTATIMVSMDHTTIGVLTRDGLEKLLKTNRPYSYDLIYRLYNTLPDRLRNLNDKYRTAINALNIILNRDRKEFQDIDGLNDESKPRTDFNLPLKKREITQVFKETIEHDADQLIFAEGDRADGAYFIMGGKVKVVTFSSDYEEIVLGELGEGEIFGEMALIDDRPRSASVVTLGPCKLGYIDKHEFNKLIETRSELSFKCMAFICLSLFLRILRLDNVYANIKKAFD